MSRHDVVQIWLHGQNVPGYPDIENMSVEQLMEDFGLSHQDACDLHLACRSSPTLYRLAPEDAVELSMVITEAMHSGLDGYTTEDQFVINMFLADLALSVQTDKELRAVAKKYR